MKASGLIRNISVISLVAVLAVGIVGCGSADTADVEKETQIAQAVDVTTEAQSEITKESVTKTSTSDKETKKTDKKKKAKKVETTTAKSDNNTERQTENSGSGTQTADNKTEEPTVNKKESTTKKSTAQKSKTKSKTKKSTGTSNVVDFKYNLKDVQKLTNLTYTTKITKNGTTSTPYRVFRTDNKIKVEWLYDKTHDDDENNDNVIGTVVYLKKITFVDGKSYKQLKFYDEPDRPGADTGYRGKDLVSPYHIWEQNDVSSIFNGKAVKEGTATIEGLNVIIYSVTNGNTTHKIYYNEKYKTWIKYEIYSGNTLSEQYLAEGFSVGNVTDTQADWKTKKIRHPEEDGYALFNISAMAGLND